MNAIAIEARDMVRRAAEPVQPGETVKAQMRRAWINLGRPKFWRVRAAWHGEAGNWLAPAFRDLEERYRAYCDKRDREARAEVALAASRLAALREVLAAADPRALGQEISALDLAIRALRRGAGKPAAEEGP